MVDPSDEDVKQYQQSRGTPAPGEKPKKKSSKKYVKTKTHRKPLKPAVKQVADPKLDEALKKFQQSLGTQTK
jgi:hypothetical protein